MRKLIVWNMVSLDGHFEGPAPWEIEWFEFGWGEELERFSLEQEKEVDSLLFGRRTYEGMAAHWSSAEGEIARFMNEVPKVVFSRTLTTAEWNNSRIVSTPAEAEVAHLKELPGRDLFIFGSGELTDSLRRANLVDEYRIALNPILLGRGNRFFRDMDERLRLDLIEARPLTTGVVILRYGRRSEGGALLPGAGR